MNPWVLLVALLGAALCHAQEPPLFEGRFDEGPDGFLPFSSDPESTPRWSADGGRDGSGALWLEAAGTGNASWYREVEATLDDVEVRVSAWVRGRGIGVPWAFNVQAFGARMGQTTGMAAALGERALTGDFDWARVEATLRAGAGTVGLFLAVPLSGRGELWFDDLRVETGPATVSAAPGLFEVRGAYRLRARRELQAPRLLFPVPSAYRDQCPLTFEVSATPASVRYIETAGNLVAEVVLEPLAEGEELELSWTSLVLCGPSSAPALPATAPLPESWPSEVAPWLTSTLAAASADPRLVALGAEIRGTDGDVAAIVARALATKRRIGASATKPGGHATALAALEHQGSCTSAANLLAALLRAASVPARVLSGYPTYGAPLQTHYIVEACVPGVGWYPIESTTLEHPLSNERFLVVSIVPVEHEDLAVARTTGGLGVPYLSLTEAPQSGADLEIVGGLEGSGLADHVASPLRHLDGTQEEWAAALERGRARGPSPAPGAREATTLEELLAALGP